MNKFQASVFGNSGFLVLIPVGVLIFIGIAYIIFKKFYEKKASEKSKKPDDSKKKNSINQSKKSKKSR